MTSEDDEKNTFQKLSSAFAAVGVSMSNAAASVSSFFSNRELIDALESEAAREAEAEAAAAFKHFSGTGCVAKVQVLMGGRGKTGGVKRVAAAAEAAFFEAATAATPTAST